MSYSHELSMQQHNSFAPSPGEGSKIIKFQLQSQFQRILYQTLCVFSQIKDIKHIERDFYSIALVMPQGWDIGEVGVAQGVNN